MQNRRFLYFGSKQPKYRVLEKCYGHFPSENALGTRKWSVLQDSSKINTFVLIFDKFENDRPVGRSFSGNLKKWSQWYSLVTIFLLRPEASRIFDSRSEAGFVWHRDTAMSWQSPKANRTFGSVCALGAIGYSNWIETFRFHSISIPIAWVS